MRLSAGTENATSTVAKVTQRKRERSTGDTSQTRTIVTTPNGNTRVDLKETKQDYRRKVTVRKKPEMTLAALRHE
jgi:hypothetical protein